MTHRRAPRSIAPAVTALAARVAPPTLLGAVQRVWPAAVGQAIAQEAQPVAERDGTVRVSCASAVWAHEIELLGPDLVEAVNRALGAQRVVRLRASATRPRTDRG